MGDYININMDTAEAAVFGGAVLGGGGGGHINDGLDLARLALQVGCPRILSIDDLQRDATLVTVSLVGAPGAVERYVKPVHYLKAIELLSGHSGIRVDGFISSENGAVGTINGWFQSAVLGMPVVDAPCNGRAHPTGAMGSMGLIKIQNYISMQAAVGGNPEKARYVEIFSRGSLNAISKLVRQSAVEAGGLVAVARNPVSAEYVKKNGAPSATRMAIQVGEALVENKENGGKAMIEAAVKSLSGELITEGKVEKVALQTTGGFDVGSVIIKGVKKKFELTFWNEYMTLDVDGDRVGTFPDLIATMSTDTGLPIITADIRHNQKVSIIHVPKDRLILGAGMSDRSLFKQVEDVIKKEMVKYVF